MVRIPIVQPRALDFRGFDPVGDYQTGRVDAARLQELAERRDERAAERERVDRIQSRVQPGQDLETTARIYGEEGDVRTMADLLALSSRMKTDAERLELRRRADDRAAAAARRTESRLTAKEAAAQAQREARVNYLVNQGYAPDEATNAVAAGFGGDLIKSTFEGGKKRTELASNLRKEFSGRQDIKDFRKTSTFANRIKSVYPDEASTAQGTGAKDIALIFSYMKILDPTSVVREGEQATAANAAGVPSSIASRYNQLLGGGTLDATARRQIIEAADDLVARNRSGIQPTIDLFRSEAERVGVDPTRIFAADLVGQNLKDKYGLD